MLLKVGDNTCKLHLSDNQATKAFKEKYSVQDKMIVTKDMDLEELRSDLFNLIKSNPIDCKEIMWNYVSYLLHELRTC